MASSDVFSVSEIFGPTFQGEGASLGMPCMFLRLAGCNLHCHWCDTPYTWRWSDRWPHDWAGVYDPKVEVHRMTVEQVYERLSSSPVKALVISGGEPLLQQVAVQSLTRLLHGDKWWVEIETAGTLPPYTSEMADRFNVSVKLSHSGNAANIRIIPDAIKALSQSGRAAWKFVVAFPDDFREIDTLVNEYGLHPVYIMPEGISRAAINSRLEMLTAEALKRGYYMTTRLQVLTYGNRRGV